MSQAHNPPTPRVEKLLNTKLMQPRSHSELIPRPDLLRRLDSGLTRKLILVSAPTGFGKTTLVSMWIASRPFRSAWVTLDTNDNDPTRFWTYFASALRRLDAALGKITLSALAAPQPASFQSLLSPLLNDMSSSNEQTVLVLDEFQNINSQEIISGLAFLIQQLPESFHLVLLSRSEPALPLGILRARAELLDITSADLQFNESETQQFLNATLSINLPPGLVNSLQERTGGWPAGLRLAAIVLQERNSAQAGQVIQNFSGGHRYVSDYLIREVFSSQPEPIQDFLLKTSFLARLTASLCDALMQASSSAAILAQLEHDNLFIVRLEHSGNQTWYRYNPLFAESIQSLARQRFEEAVLQSLFEKASAWYEYHGLYDEAIESALAAKFYQRAMLLIEKFIEMHDLSEIQTLNRWLEEIPQPELLLHPTICFTFAQVILYSSDRFAPATLARIEPYLQAAELLWDSQGNFPHLGRLLSFRGTLAWWQADIGKALEYARRSVELLPESDALWRGNSLLILGQAALDAGQMLEAQDYVLEARALSGAAQNVYSVLAATQLLSEDLFWQGQMDQAELLNHQILVDAVGDESMLDDQGVAALLQSRIAYERNDLVQSGQDAHRALALGEQRGNQMLQVQAAIQLACLQSAQNEPARALDLLRTLQARLQNPLLLRELQNMQALLSIRAGDTASLAGWLKLISGPEPKLLAVQKERQEFILARWLISAGHFEEALVLLEPWQKDSAGNGRVRSQVEAYCLEALAWSAKPAKAAATLLQALAIGQAHGFRRIFLDEGPHMAELLQASLSTPSNRSLSLYAASLLHSFSAEMQPNLSTGASRLGLEPLSQQELRVLRLLAAGLSNPAIAQELVVSTNTIKTQVKSIYHKLNVNSRLQARDLARELKLLD